MTDVISFYQRKIFCKKQFCKKLLFSLKEIFKDNAPSIYDLKYCYYYPTEFTPDGLLSPIYLACTRAYIHPKYFEIFVFWDHHVRGWG